MERASSIPGARLLSGAIPVLFAIFCVFFANLPISVLGGFVPAPLLALMPVYFWCLVRPDLMTPGWAFVIGVLQDMLSGGPPGIWTASFVLTYALIDRQRDAFAGLSGWGALLGFATAALITCGTAYTIFDFYNGRLLSATSMLDEFAMTVLFYAPVALIMGLVHHHLVGPLRSEI